MATDQVRERDAEIVRRMDAGESPAVVAADLPRRFGPKSVRGIYRSHLEAVAEANDRATAGCHCGQHRKIAAGLRQEFDGGVLYFIGKSLRRPETSPLGNLREWLSANYS